jgi:uncharacterized protein (DUF697 family)
MSTYEYEGQEYAPQQEYGFQEYEAEYEGEYEEEFGTTHEAAYGETSHYEGGYPGEYEEEFGTAHEAAYGEVGHPGELESPLNEAEEMNLASQLLEVSNEQELEQFLGNLLKGVARGVGGFMRSGVGRALGGVLKNVAKTALPVVGGALGSFIAPGVGTAIGSKLGSMAGNLFELELESMDREEQEFEVARGIVRLSAAAARNAAMAPPEADAQEVANRAVLTAARRYAPGVARRFRRFARPGPWYWPQPVPYGSYGGPGGYDNGAQEPWGEPDGGFEGQRGGWSGMGGGPRGGNGSRPRSGRWIMRGRRLIVLGV